MAKRLLEYCNNIFIYAIATDRIANNPAYGLSKALKPRQVQNRLAFGKKDLPEFFKRLNENPKVGLRVKYALLIVLLTAVRGQELRFSTWDYIDWDNALWELPEEVMKKRREHLVPLSTQAIAVLKKLQKITGIYTYIAQGHTYENKPISQDTMQKALWELGYKDIATVHGFRSTFSTIMHENDFSSDHIEMQLAHKDRDATRLAYNRAKYLEQRKAMMQWWGDYLEDNGLTITDLG